MDADSGQEDDRQPATTVEHFPPNVYADRIEWFGRNFSARAAAVLSVIRTTTAGTAVATAELGLMAGADRVEGRSSATGSGPGTSTSSRSRSTF